MNDKNYNTNNNHKCNVNQHFTKKLHTAIVCETLTSVCYFMGRNYRFAMSFSSKDRYIYHVTTLIFFFWNCEINSNKLSFFFAILRFITYYKNVSVIVRENRAVPKDRGRPFTFIFSQYKTYPKRLTTMTFAEVGVRFSSRYQHIMILGSQTVENGRHFGQL